MPTYHSYTNAVARIALAMGANDPRRKVVVVLVCKLDASGTDRANKVITMAGYVALLPAWSEFEIEARAICDRQGVSVLHAKEFYDTKGDFHNWSRERKENFVREIHDISLGKLELGVSFSILKSEFMKARSEHKVAHSESAFGFCFRSVAHALVTDTILARVLNKGEDLTFVLEQGDKNAADAERVFQWIKAQNDTLNRVMYSFGFTDKKSSVGLQWADFLAVTTRRYATEFNRLGKYPEEPRIVSILRAHLYMIDHVAEVFLPVPKRGRRG
jgi:hypothetical protein